MAVFPIHLYLQNRAAGQIQVTGYSFPMANLENHTGVCTG